MLLRVWLHLWWADLARRVIGRSCRCQRFAGVDRTEAPEQARDAGGRQHERLR